MNTRYVFSLTLALLFFGGCTSMFELQHTGDVIDLDYEGQDIRCELLAVSDSMMYLIPTADNKPGTGLEAGRIYAAPPYVFRSGDVQGYSNRSWLTPFLIFQVVPIIMYAIEAASYEHDNTAAVMVLPIFFGSFTLLEFVLLHSATNDPPGFDRALMPEELLFLRKYARYPQGLTAEQLKLLLAVRNQTEPHPMPAPITDSKYRMGS
jgi:hypothetical protein